METYSIETLGKKLGKNRAYIGWLIKYGLLPTRKLGRNYLITEEDLDEFYRRTTGMTLTNEASIKKSAGQVRSK